jgi:hypothetical protein
VIDVRTGLYIINIQDPAHPQPAGSYYSQGTAYGVFLAYPLAYVADGSKGVAVLDIGNPVNPQLMGRAYTPGTVMDVWTEGKFVYAADGADGLVIIKADSPTSPVAVGRYNTPGTAQAVCVKDNIAYVADADHGLCLINVQDQAHPALISSVDTPGDACDVAVEAGYAFLADGPGDLAVVDVHNPQKPVLIAHVEVPGTVREVYLKDGKVYLASGDAGLQILSQESFWTLQVQQVNSEGTQIQALLPPGLRRGDYTLRVTNPDDGLADWQTDMLGISGMVYIPDGLNLLVCPDSNQGIMYSDELLAYLGEEYAKSVQGYDPVSQKFQTTTWSNGEIRGKVFLLSESAGCLLYMKKGRMVDFSIDQIGVFSLSLLASKLTPGMNILGIPANLFSDASTSYQLLDEFLKTGDVSCLQRYNQQAGNWLTTYQFMGKSCGDVYPVPKGEGCVIYLQ